MSIFKSAGIFLSLFIFVGCCAFMAIAPASYSVDTPALPYKIVLDAGHGGIDVGAVGVSGTSESDLNLEYTLELKEQLEKYGFSVALTRSTKDGLYSEYKNGFKMEDMEKRREIVQAENPDLFISLHQNKFAASSSYGPQVFYAPNSETAKSFAQCIKQSFDENLDTKKREVKEGDFYMLRCVDSPSILIECGFLSNPAEEKLLLNKDYQKEFCYLIVCGIFKFLA